MAFTRVINAGVYCSATTLSETAASTSGCSRTAIGWVPTDLMCALGSWTVRLSRFGPPAFLIAATTSAAVTEPNSLPVSRGRLHGQRHRAEALERGLQLVGVLEAAHGLDLAGPTNLLGLALGAAGRHDGQSARQQVVAAVAVLDLDGVAGRTQVVDLGGKNQFHL